MKIIYVSQRVDIINNERRDSYSQEWNLLAEACGFLPVFVPNSVNILDRLISKIRPEGIILTGGNDLMEYNGNAPERDTVEKALIKYAENLNIPLLGICRGMQMILNYYGIMLERIEGHVDTNHNLSTGKIVNSYHNWGCTECMEPLEVISCSRDGCVEEVIHNTHRKIRGIMWHPERYNPLRKDDIEMIRRFLEI